MGNPGNWTAISVHLYGPRIGGLDGRDYDPSVTTSVIDSKAR